MYISKRLYRMFVSICLAMLILFGLSQEARGSSLEEMMRNIVPILTLDGLPAGTLQAEVEALLKHDQQFYELKYQLMVGPDGEMLLKDFEIELEQKQPDEEFVFPEAAPEEDPFASIRNSMKALLAKNPERLSQYVPKEERQDISPDDLSRQLARDQKRKQEKGYSEIEVLSANLPASISVPAGVAALKIEYHVPAEVNGQNGYFDIDIEWAVEEVQPVNWVIHDMDVDFRTE